MYVCICKGVTEAQICQAIERGLCSRGEIAACLKAGTGCGKCGSEIRDLLRRALPSADGRSHAVRTEARERKHGEPRRHAALSARSRRATHAAAGAESHEPASAAINS